MNSWHKAKLQSLVKIKPCEAGIKIEKAEKINTSYCGKVYFENKVVDVFWGRYREQYT